MDYGNRPDGSAKGMGFFGELKRPDGDVSTEISVGVGMDGKEMDIPLIVPTLTKKELNYLLSTDIKGKNFFTNMPPSKQAEALANQMMRSKFPDFVGVNHPEALDQLMGRGGYSPKGAGAMRKQFAFASKQKSLDSLGWPSYEDARNSITHPLLAQANVGDSGLSSFLSNPGAELIKDSGHNSYNRGISGTDAQSLAVSIPAKNMFPTLYKASQSKTNKAGKKFTHDQIVGDIKMGHYYQMPDQQWLDQIMPVYEQEIQKALLTNGLLSAFP